jgi:hypothetical protein
MTCRTCPTTSPRPGNDRQTRPRQDGKIQTKVISEDEGPRAGVTAESLGKLKPVPGTKLERFSGEKTDLGGEKYGEQILLPGKKMD